MHAHAVLQFCLGAPHKGATFLTQTGHLARAIKHGRACTQGLNARVCSHVGSDVAIIGCWACTAIPANRHQHHAASLAHVGSLLVPSCAATLGWKYVISTHSCPYVMPLASFACFTLLCSCQHLTRWSPGKVQTCCLRSAGLASSQLRISGSMKRKYSVKSNRIGERWHVICCWHKCRGDLDRVHYRTGFRHDRIVRIVRQYLNTGTVNDRPRSGRPKRLSRLQAEALSAAVEAGQSVPAAAAQLKQQGVIPKSVSDRTSRRAVTAASDYRTAVIKPLLTAAAKAKRVAFSQHRYRVGNLVAVDSCIFRCFGFQPRRGVWVPKGTRPVCPKPVKGQQLHVYGGISKHGRTKLITVTGSTGLKKRYFKGNTGILYDGVCAQEFQERVLVQLNRDAKRIMQRAGQPPPVFLLDGARPHTATSTKAFMAAKGISYLHGWPSYSPDLNPIENVWAMMKREVAAHNPCSMAALSAAVNAAWKGVTRCTAAKLMRSFPRRLTKCINMGGECTGY